MNKRFIGIYINTNNKKITTLIDYRSKTKFQNLIQNYSNAKLYIPKSGDKFLFVPAQDILNDAYNNLKNTKAYNLIITLLAQNQNITS